MLKLLFFQTGEKLYKMIGTLPEKDLSMLEERIKRCSLTRPPPGGGAPPPPAAAPAPQPVLPSQEPRYFAILFGPFLNDVIRFLEFPPSPVYVLHTISMSSTLRFADLKSSISFTHLSHKFVPVYICAVIS